MTRVYTYRVENLTPAKHCRLEAFFSHLMWLYNQVVEYCRAQYAEGAKTPTYYDLCKWLTGKRGEDTRTGRWNVPCQRSILNRVRRGYDKFFRDHKGLPRYKSFDRGVRSFETEAAKPRKRKNDKGYYVQIKGLGRLSFTDTRGILDDATVRIVRVVRSPLRYEIQLVCDIPEPLRVVDKRDVVGIDMGVKSSVTLSNAMQYRPLAHDDTRRKRMQRKVSRAKRGGNGRKKAKVLLAKESRRISIRRQNAIHRMTTEIVKTHSANLVLEDLKVQNMTASGGSRKRGLNRSMLQQAWGEIGTQLVYKAESAGGQCVRVPPHHTTQTCSNCMSLPPESIDLSVRTYECKHCGYVADRDVNTARNVRRKGLDSFHRVGLSPERQAEVVKPVRLDGTSVPDSTVMARNRSITNTQPVK